MLFYNKAGYSDRRLGITGFKEILDTLEMESREWNAIRKRKEIEEQTVSDKWAVCPY